MVVLIQISEEKRAVLRFTTALLKTGTSVQKYWWDFYLFFKALKDELDHIACF